MNAPVKFAGRPRGPKQFIKSLGQEVATFLEDPGGKHPALNYHVPLHMRGPYRLEELPDEIDWYPTRFDKLGYVLCDGSTKAGEKCSKRAENRSPRCKFHGGRLHPLDKLIEEELPGSNDAENQSLSRYQLFKAGQITVDDLDDEELATCGFRAKDGRIFKPRNVPRELVQEFTKAIYERAQQELKGHTVKAAQTVAEIMLNTAVEPDIRLKAANTLLDRGLGKAPQHISMTHDVTGFEEVFSAIVAGPQPETIDAESVDITEDRIAIESSGNSVPREADSDEGFVNSRLYERNEAVLAQTIEIKPFEYDLRDKSAEIKKATQKRYASRALGVNLTGPSEPYVRVDLGNGMFKHCLADELKIKAPQSNSAKEARKRFTLSDFD